jgi:integrase/recombinase XerD
MNLEQMVHLFEQVHRSRHRPTTQKIWQHHLQQFILWCQIEQISDIQHVTPEHIERYEQVIQNYRKSNGKPYCKQTQANKLGLIGQFFSWLTKRQYLIANPATELTRPKVDSLPKQILSQTEVEKVLQQPNTLETYGIRDRAIMELFYSTGLRRMELLALKREDLDLKNNTLRVRNGKGGADRVIPIGQRAILWIKQWNAQPLKPGESLFTMPKGRPILSGYLGKMVRAYLDQAGIKKPGSCHLFRHSCATHMLDNGADICTIQALLGHKNLQTTAIYAQVSIRQLKQIHERTHPAKMHPLPSDRITKTALIQRIHQEKQAGKTWQRIADELNQDAIPTLTGRNQWTISALRQALKTYQRLLEK